MSEVTVKLQRDNPSQPWGFRIHGGVDFNQPLLILRVTAGSIASQPDGLQPGDQITQINGQDALRLRHREAQQLILNGGNQVNFQVVREADGANLVERLLLNNPDAIQRIPSIKRKTVQSSSTSSSAVASVVQSASTVSVAPAVGTQGWKGPKFTEDGIKETIMSQAQVLACGAIGVNFMKNQEKNLDMDKSEVLKMLNEMEKERKVKAQSPAPQQMGPQSPSAFGLINRAYEAAIQAQQPSAPWVNQQQLSPAASAPVQ